jgi:putative hydrolase of the HAD superfamily
MIKAIVFDCYGVLVSNDLVQQPNEVLFAYIRDALKPHYKIGMLSNATAGEPERLFTPEQTSLLDDMVVSGEIGHAKPEREVFEIAAKRLGVNFDEIIFVDDIERYVLSAREMGIRSILFADLDSLKRQLAAILVSAA